MVINSKIQQKEEGVNVIVQWYAMVKLSHGGRPRNKIMWAKGQGKTQGR
jgi:hypothetical protein